MAAYTQFGYGSYPSANQLLGGNVSQTSTAIMSHNAPSPLSGSNENSLSPSGGSSASSSSSAASSSGNGPLSPGAMSQSSTHNAGRVPPNATASSSLTNALGNGPEGSAVSATTAAAAAALAAASTSNHSTTGGSAAGGGGCCENGRPIMTDPVSGQTVCSCQYDSARLALSNYSRMPAAGVGVYGTAYPSNEQNPYPSIGVDSSAFYTPLNNPYSLKESAAGTDMSAWSTAGLQPTTGYYSYDPTFAYGYGASYDLASRRKNATRESTATLKAWLNEHKKNPYPTKGEKIMLAIITKMTLTQVSTWFANARRRLKKENKMTWEPKNRTEDDDDDAMLSDDEKDLDKSDMHKSGGGSGGSGNIYGQQMHKEHEQLKSDHHAAGKHDLKDDEEDRKPENLTATRQLENYNTASLYGVSGGGGGGGHHSNSYNPYQNQQQMYYQQQQQLQGGGYLTNPAAAAAVATIRDECGIPIPATKPKIWSVADTVANKTPPPTQASAAYMMSNSQQQQLAAQSYYANNLQINNHLSSNNSPLSMMSNYVNASATTPYSRLSAGYPAVTANYAGQMNTTTSNSSSSSSLSSVNMMQMPQQYTTQSLHNQQQQQQHQQQQQQHQQSSGRLGFPEIQPDTPPQTPPNMKHANNMNSLMGNTSSASSSSNSLGYNGNNSVLNSSYGSDASSMASRSGLEMQ